LHARVETELARLELPDHAGKLLIGAVARHPASPAESGSSPPATQFLVAQRMSEAPATVLDMGEVSTELDARLELVERLATPLPSLLPRMRDPELGRWMAQQLDALLRNVTAGCGALDVAIGEGLHALDVGRRVEGRGAGAARPAGGPPRRSGRGGVGQPLRRRFARKDADARRGPEGRGGDRRRHGDEDAAGQRLGTGIPERASGAGR